MCGQNNGGFTFARTLVKQDINSCCHVINMVFNLSKKLVLLVCFLTNNRGKSFGVNSPGSLFLLIGSNACRFIYWQALMI